MKKILWLSQHQPLPQQLVELKRLFGDVEVHQDVSPFQSAEGIKWRFDQGGFDEIAVVVPLSVLAKLCELGLRPLWSEMRQVQSRREADFGYRGRFYRFIRIRRVKAVKLEFEDVESSSPPRQDAATEKK